MLRAPAVPALPPTQKRVNLMRRLLTVIGQLLFLGSAASLSAQNAQPEPGPCEQIVAACKQAGFIEGDYKNGNGLYGDCVGPLMRDTAQPQKAKILLPKVSADLVAACKQKHPNFGERRQGQGKPSGESSPAAPATSPPPAK
jgi:hypothetical protein